jgi:ABC-type dipeptide/oligopeptide/nickel transport system permease component
VTRFLARRLVFAALVVWGAVTVIFVIVRLIPGDPASVMLGPSATAEQVDALRARLGLDTPLIAQYLDYLRSALVLDFGESVRLGVPAADSVLRRVPATATLALVAITLALVISFPLGIRAARRPGSWSDRSIRVSSLVGQNLPTFWVGIVLLIVFSRWLRLFPSAGDDGPMHYVLPAIVLALPLIGTLVRLVRGGLLDVLAEPYVQTARAKGLRHRAVLYGHAVPNMLIPVVTVVGLMLGDLLAGLVLVEVVFSWPGLGRLLVDAIDNRDYPVIQASVAFIAIVYVLLNLVVDMTYGVLDPRVRVAGTA